MSYSNVILIYRRIGRSLLQAAAPAPDVAGIPQTPLPAVSSPADHNKELDSTKVLIILFLVIALGSLGFLCLNISGFINHILSPDTPPSSSNSDHRAQPRNSKGGLASSAVDSLPVLAYGKHTMIDDCPICLIEFEERECVKLIPYCGHVFHPTCIDTWFDSHVTCPVCRSAELFKRDDEVCLDMTQDKDGEMASTVENWTRGG